MELIKQLEDSVNRILVVGPHPDDIEFSTGRLIMHRKGKNVFTICMTDGRRGQEGTAVKKLLNEDDYARLRIKETMIAQSELHIDINNQFFMNLPDQDVVSNPYIIDKLFMIIRRIKPDFILIPPWEGAHPDHDATHLFLKIVTNNLGFDKNKIIEYGSYNNFGGEFSIQEFVPYNNYEGEKFIPTPNQQIRWRNIMKIFKSQLNQQKDYIPKSRFENFRILPDYDYSKLPYSSKRSEIIRNLLGDFYQITGKLLTKKEKLFYETWSTKLNPIKIKEKLTNHIIHYGV